MLKRLYILLLIGLIGFISWSFISESQNLTIKVTISENSGISDVLNYLGDKESRNPIKFIDTELVEVGRKLLFEGKANYKSYKAKRISAYFVCTDCHNMVQEYPTLTGTDAQERLDYAVKEKIPFLPASTLFSIYNRETFYTKDYYKKYGDLIENAKDSLENAVQVCSKYCSSGRFLEQWEEDAIMHYFKANELKLSALDLDKETLLNVFRSGSLEIEKRTKLIDTIKSKYTQKYVATFLETKPRDERTYGKNGDVQNGKKIYEKSCMHCHDNGRVTNLDLDKDVLSAGLLWKHRKDYTDESPYQIVRHGTYPKTGRQQYMPLYPEEKMSKAQVEDLLAYIKELAKK